MPFIFQKLANILHSSELTDDDTIEEILGISSFQEFTFEKPSSDSKLEERELGRLAKEIDRKAIHNRAVNKMGFTEAQVQNILTDNKADSWSASFEMLVKWSFRSKENNRQVSQKREIPVGMNTFRCISLILFNGICENFFISCSFVNLISCFDGMFFFTV